MLLDLELIKVIFLYIIFFVSVFYQIILMGSMFIHRHEINFLSTIKRGNRISKAGIFFFILMTIIIYQALFTADVSLGLIELMGIIIAGDLGSTWIKNQKELNLQKVKKTSEKDMTVDDINNL